MARRLIGAYTPADDKADRHLLSDGAALCGLNPRPRWADSWHNQNDEELDESMWLRRYCAACLTAAGVSRPDADDDAAGHRRVDDEQARQLDERREDERRGRVTCPKCGALGWWRFRTTSVNSVKFVCDGGREENCPDQYCLDPDIYVHANPDFDTALERLKTEFRERGWRWPYE